MTELIPWTKISHLDIFYAAEQVIDKNNLPYHNMNHVKSMYRYLSESKVPYNLELDFAVLFHDIIYDKGDHKESRSAKAFEGMFHVHKMLGFPSSSINGPSFGKCLKDVDIETTKNLIHDTTAHVVMTRDKFSVYMILADLHQLKDPLMVYKNFGLIMEESTKLYGINETKFAEQSEIFMNGLMARITDNLGKTKFDDEFEEILMGIASTRTYSRLIRGL